MSNNIFGCFTSGPAVYGDADDLTAELAEKKGTEFRKYIWGDKGICDELKKLDYNDYGQDIKLILFQFYINPLPYELKHLKEIEGYRKNERSIGIPIIIDEDNFFSLSEQNRYIFLVEIILEKLDILKSIIERKKLDTDITSLKADMQKLEIFPKNLS